MPYAADTQISGLDAAAALTGAELLAMSQGGAAVQDDLGAVRTLFEQRQLAGARALDLLAGEEGLAIDFLARSAAIRDFAQAKNFLGRPEDLLTVSRASTAAYIDRERVLKYAGTGVLRYDHDPSSGAPLGALIEGSRTNLLTRSEEADNAAWAKAKTTVTANAVAAPDGATTADTLVEDNTSGEHYLDQNFAATNAVVYTWSTWVKAAAGTRSLRLRTATAVAAFVDFNPSTGVLGTPSGGTAKATAYANGWYRVELTVTAGSTTTLVCRRQVVNAGSTSYLGDLTQAFYLWGAQLEVGAFASSYIPTTTATVTRSADAVTLLVSAIPFDTAQGAVVCKVRTIAIASAAAWQIDDGDNTDCIRMRISSGSTWQAVVQNASVNTVNMVSGAVTTAQLWHIALGWRADDFAVSYNGAAVGTDTASAVPAGLTTVRFGSIAAAADGLYGHLQQLRVLSRRPTNTELQALAA